MTFTTRIKTPASNSTNILHSQTATTQLPPERWTAIDLLRGCALLAMLITHSAWRIPDFDYRAAYGCDLFPQKLYQVE
jgi:uncharacterized membrane protein